MNPVVPACRQTGNFRLQTLTTEHIRELSLFIKNYQKISG